MTDKWIKRDQALQKWHESDVEQQLYMFAWVIQVYPNAIQLPPKSFDQLCSYCNTMKEFTQWNII